ncbi:hypothetical protein TD95_003386 [Thielaviopsis punctulata]|uniref:NADP-dependent oxidoreductase domain-containing protein n=1 Tax=Thielaviopsis punctulata TaxID=72032 RepID=A0A0F4ZKE1_9PEZI|nr:hypothetical protein TD95_003386 [Thielaviopsis punctulata]
MAPRRTTLGNSNVEINQLGLGLGSLSPFYGPAGTHEELLRFLDHAWEIGNRNWDTADAYGDSEDIIGKWFALHPERRADIFLATKFGLKMAPEEISINSSPEYCRQHCELSLKRMGIECIDLYYVHRIDPVTPIEKTIEMMVQLKKEGKIKALGLSECHSSTLRRAHAIHPISAIQVEYNPWSLEIEQATSGHILDVAKELNVSVFAYSPLSRGLLTGAIKSVSDLTPGDWRLRLQRFSPENFNKNLVLVDTLKAISKRKGCTVAQLTLAWLMEQSPYVVPIPGTKRVVALDENWGSNEVVLTPKDLEEVRKAVDAAGVAGDRDASALGSYLVSVPL